MVIRAADESNVSVLNGYRASKIHFETSKYKKNLNGLLQRHSYNWVLIRCLRVFSTSDRRSYRDAQAGNKNRDILGFVCAHLKVILTSGSKFCPESHYWNYPQFIVKVTSDITCHCHRPKDQTLIQWTHYHRSALKSRENSTGRCKSYTLQ